MALAASMAVPGRLKGMSAWALSPKASFCAFGIPSATLPPSGVVTKAPSSFAAVNRVRIWPNATLELFQHCPYRSVHKAQKRTHVFARTPNEGPHSLAITLEKPVTPAFAMP